MFGTILTALAAAAAQPTLAAPAAPPPLSVAADHRHLEAGGEPWFWLGDTAWLLLSRDRQSVVSGTSVSVRVDLGGRRILKKKKIKETTTTLRVHEYCTTNK